MPSVRRLSLVLWIVWCVAAPAWNSTVEEWVCAYRLFPPKLQDGSYPHHYRPDRTVDVEHLKLELKVFMDDKRIEGTAQYRFKPIHDRVTMVRFDAYNMNIQTIASQEQPSLEWTYSDNAVYLEFPDPLPMDSSVTVAIRYSSIDPKTGGLFNNGMHFTHSKQTAALTADQLFTIAEPFGASSWFPCVDYPNDRLVTEMIVTVPREFVTLSNGKLVKSEPSDGWRTDYWTQEIPHVVYLVSLVVGKFDIVRDVWRDIPVEYYVEEGLAPHARPSMGKTPDMIEFFSNYLDYPYPYEKYAQVAVRYFTAGGMEHTTATTMYEWIVLDESARLDTEMDWIIMHELAHQWFGDLVTCDSWPELWLNEGFASYSEALWAEYSRGKDEYLRVVLDDMEGYINSSRGYTRAIVTNTFENPDEMFDSHSYPKASSVLHMLRHELGDELFRESIRHYLKSNAPGLVETGDLMDAIEQTTGRPLDRFFEQWIYRPGHPKLKVEHQYYPERGQVKITIRQTQEMETGTMPFAFPLDVEVCLEDQSITKTIAVSTLEETVWLDCPKPPKSIAIDPELKVLKEIEHEKSRDMLLHDLRHGSSIIVKIYAARALDGHRDDEVRRALAQTANSDAYVRVRTEAIEKLGAYRTEAALDDILGLIDDPDAKIRNAVVRALEGFSKNRRAVAALKERFEQDPANNVRAAAARTLARLKVEDGYTILKSGLKIDSWQHRVRTSAMNALVDLEEPRVYDDLVKFSKDPYHRDVRASAIRAMGRLSGSIERFQRETLDLLSDYLMSSSSTIRLAAISGLAALGDKKAIPDLQWIQFNDEDERVREAAANAIKEIRKEKQSDLAGENAKRLDELQEEKKQWLDRMDEMEKSIQRVFEQLEKSKPNDNEDNQ